MSRIDELDDQARKAIAKVETHLEGHAASMVTTANTCIVLGTTLAGGIAVLAKDSLPGRPGLFVVALLLGSALCTIVSLLFGVLVYDSRSRISEKAVVMWDASKHLVLGILVKGGGDEAATEREFLDSIPTIAETLRSTAADFEKEYKRMSLLLTWQVGLLVAGIAIALLATPLAYWGQADSSSDTAGRASGICGATGSCAGVNSGCSRR